ncbi:PASTA domain-containing protein [Bacteroides caecigallinarum]|uniref:PASTA domain-containing protein n=1 Tax=Bacteroides caecigallinarum TaxID=1411144 RepID=UPI00195EBCE4|nr:PASTA domain-containing protein [Bacteroides caecigallinarum]MBM6883101.1 PASTA domain-containing protein [Bacteroides caecigallinarum]MBM6890764.1 PASTA domain-containing protein [Bacteroides caecigallinarum]MCF2551850.1 PASTA domain-containing protein [Bacteroides caecigallinarum]
MIGFKDFFSFRKNKLFWINIIGIIVVLIIITLGTLVWLDSYTRHGEAHIVPDVKNKNIVEAEMILNESTMKCVVVDSNYVKGVPEGMVLEQIPVAGAKVKEGRTIYLTITTTSVPLVQLPDIIDNSSIRQAEAKLKSMGFKLTEPELVPGEQDWIYGIKYRGRDLKSGDKVPNEAMLTLCVGDTHLRDSLAMDSTYIDMNSIPQSDEEAKVDDSWF